MICPGNTADLYLLATQYLVQSSGPQSCISRNWYTLFRFSPYPMETPQLLPTRRHTRSLIPLCEQDPSMCAIRFARQMWLGSANLVLPVIVQACQPLIHFRSWNQLLSLTDIIVDYVVGINMSMASILDNHLLIICFEGVDDFWRLCINWYEAMSALLF